jgi:hypothetical protein
MPQDRDTGAAANDYGRTTARRIATKIGATVIPRSSNECRLDGEKIVIKCARFGTPSIGVTYKMLDRLDGILGAFELNDGSYDLFLLGPDAFRENMSATQSMGSSAGKVGMVAKRVFVQRGHSRGNVRLDRNRRGKPPKTRLELPACVGGTNHRRWIT